MAVTRYFLVAIRPPALSRFYGQFLPGPEDFLWVIKGGRAAANRAL